MKRSSAVVLLPGPMLVELLDLVEKTGCLGRARCLGWARCLGQAGSLELHHPLERADSLYQDRFLERLGYPEWDRRFV